MPLDPQLAKYCDDHQDEQLQLLKALIAIPSVSANPEYNHEVRRCAQALVDRMNTLGLDAQLLETNGHPIAYGEWLGAPGKPTAIVYGHLDVQPAEPLELWTTPPFQATVRDGKIFGRGAVDDKGQVAVHLSAIEAHRATRGSLPINLKVVIEGEEEIGSPNFENALERYREKFKADFAIISDTAMYSAEIPSLTISIRGLVHWEVAVFGPPSDLHSGLHGGAIANPIEALSRIVASLKDETGRIRIPGFYDGVLPMDAATRAELQTLAGGSEQEMRRMEQIWFLPTLECNGIWGGYQGPGTKTIIPSSARAKLSSRLVGDQDPSRIKAIVSEYIKKSAPEGVRVEVEASADTRAIRTARDHFAVAAAARAVESVFGKKPVYIGSGGTIGPVASFDRVLKIPQVLLGFGLPDDSTHAPNEKFTLSQFFGGIKTIAQLYDELA